jgi:hypothetical protein
MPIVRIENADADANPARGSNAGRSRGQHATIEGVLGKPYRMEAIRLGGFCQLEAALGRKPAM